MMPRINPKELICELISDSEGSRRMKHLHQKKKRHMRFLKKTHQLAEDLLVVIR